jgi:hypothetical protein
MTQYREPHRERHTVFNLGPPAVLALLVSFTLGAGRCAWLVLDGERMDDAVDAGARWFIILICIQMFFYPAMTWGVRLLERILLERIRQPTRTKPRRERRMPPIFNGPRSRRQKKTKKERREGALSGIGNVMRAAGSWLAPGHQPFKGGHYAQQAQALSVKREPSRSRRQVVEESALVDLFKMVHHMYDKKLTRDSFEIEFPGENGQNLYVEYKRHWLRRGWVNVNKKGTMTSWRYEEHELYESDPALKVVAAQMGFQFPEEGQ